ncbi:dnaJ homolog subfamily C member 10-like [Oratosquilla oratoria]|uniref:dnaJ homolog subfamily C member 10-like n=1 Tax=Oratosquilla oratoria TaxID=337810 RepID=UPI003F760AE8
MAQISIAKGTLLVLLVFVSAVCAEDYYELLGIKKDADSREIRKAFKHKALTIHPDKNKDDPDAHDKFVKLNKVYEVLKDTDLRRKYDLYGEEGLDENRSHQQYHSWTFYRDNFGIYDDDPEIITLNKADFEQNVAGSQDIWFINFYHPSCSHCHTLAPAWRAVARALEGVVRIGAVNCDDDYQLCSTQGIRSYPTLLSYPGRKHYRRVKSEEELIDYIMEQLTAEVTTLQWKYYENIIQKEEFDSKPWLVLFYSDVHEADDMKIVEKKLSAIFEGLINIGRVECFQDTKLCKTLDMESGVKFFDASKIKEGEGTQISSLNAQEIAKEVLKLLPEMRLLDEDEYTAIRSDLENKKETTAWFILFSGDHDDINFDLKKLPALMPSLHQGQVKCSKMKRHCDDLYISKTPALVVFKMGGGYEIHQGRLIAHDIANFAKESASSVRFQILTPKEFPEVIRDGSMWFIDFYAPWCPPCKKLLPEFRKASRLIELPVNFGSVDCTAHHALCSKFNIREYPTTILYNHSIPHTFMGYHSAHEIIDFVKDTLNPAVITLDDIKFKKHVMDKPEDEMWVVDFYANWCGPCLQMAPEYRKFARLIANMKKVHVAQVDCAKHASLCTKQGINGYPTVLMYPMGSFGVRRRVVYNDWSRDANSFKLWVYNNLPSKVTTLTIHRFYAMLHGDEPFVVDFFAPWCGHCQVFSPVFEEIATEMENDLLFAKVNCDTNQRLCQDAGVRAYPTVRFYKGSVSGARQDPYGINLPNLDKRHLVSELKKKLSSTKRMRDEL